MKNKSHESMKLTKKERAWVLYDVGNSAFTMLMTSLIPIWFKDLAIKGSGMSMDDATATWALAISVVTVIVAFLGPIVGAVTDLEGMKKPIFTTVTAIGCISCILMGFMTGWITFLLIFMVARLTFSASLVFYDSMLNDITTNERSDEVSSHGFAWGYIGSCLPFIVVLAIYAADLMLGLVPSYIARILGCLITAIWWFVMTLPLLKNYKQIYFVEGRADNRIKDVFVRLGRTFKDIAFNDRKVFYFLIAFFLYIDGVGTIITNAVNIGTDLGLDIIGQVVLLLATQVVAWIFSLLFGRLSRKISTVKILYICILGYFGVSLYALGLKHMYQFGILAFFVGVFQGSIQAMSRSYYSKIIPPEQSGEYFGIYDIFSKGASFVGSLMIALVKYAGGTINIAVATLSIFFFLGYLVLRKADKIEG